MFIKLFISAVFTVWIKVVLSISNKKVKIAVNKIINIEILFDSEKISFDAILVI